MTQASADGKKKWVYTFAAEKAEGDARMTELLGGKGANLAEMARLRLNVPPGFTITTEACAAFVASGKVFPEAWRSRWRERSAPWAR